MLALLDLQARFGAALLDIGNASAANGLALRDDDSERIMRGLAAYRRSVRANLSAALCATYPTVETIVGSDFLTGVAARYVLAVPSRSGDLNLYGDRFGDFLADTEECAELPWLPDLARLEWQVFAVSQEADALAQDLSGLAACAADGWGSLRFRLDPAHAVFVSAWPVVDIWRLNQTGFEGDMTVDFRQPQSALVRRSANGVTVDSIAPAYAAFLTALVSQNTLDQALGIALSVDGGFDLTAALQSIVSSALFVAVAPPFEN